MASETTSLITNTAYSSPSVTRGLVTSYSSATGTNSGKPDELILDETNTIHNMMLEIVAAHGYKARQNCCEAGACYSRH